jgi:hypothetical protein
VDLVEGDSTDLSVMDHLSEPGGQMLLKGLLFPMTELLVLELDKGFERSTASSRRKGALGLDLPLDELGGPYLRLWDSCTPTAQLTEQC